MKLHFTSAATMSFVDQVTLGTAFLIGRVATVNAPKQQVALQLGKLIPSLSLTHTHTHTHLHLHLVI